MECTDAKSMKVELAELPMVIELWELPIDKIHEGSLLHILQLVLRNGRLWLVYIMVERSV